MELHKIMYIRKNGEQERETICFNALLTMTAETLVLVIYMEHFVENNTVFDYNISKGILYVLQSFFTCSRQNSTTQT